MAVCHWICFIQRRGCEGGPVVPDRLARGAGCPCVRLHGAGGTNEARNVVLGLDVL